MASQVQFPSPIGGVPFDLDYAPSIIFAFAYAIIVVIFACRLIGRVSSFTGVVLGTLAFALERIVIFALRAIQAHTPSEDNSSALTQYWQMTFAIGYLSMYGDLCAIMRTLYVKTTCGDDKVDQPRRRFWFRRIFGISTILVWLPLVMGLAAGYLYVPAEKNAGKADTVQSLRYATTVFAFLLILNLQAVAIYGFTIPAVRKSSVMLSLVIASFLNIISVYRLFAMRDYTTSLTSMAAGSLNSPMAKTAFYICQAAPEFLAAAVLLCVDVRTRFVTGMWGDRSTDEKPASEKA